MCVLFSLLFLVGQIRTHSMEETSNENITCAHFLLTKKMTAIVKTPFFLVISLYNVCKREQKEKSFTRLYLFLMLEVTYNNHAKFCRRCI